MVSSVLVAGDGRADAIADFAESYADQNERDHSALVDAVKTGRLTTETGIWKP
jgi:hypothetical protein